jgi:hypothetical protein
MITVDDSCREVSELEKYTAINDPMFKPSLDKGYMSKDVSGPVGIPPEKDDIARSSATLKHLETQIMDLSDRNLSVTITVQDREEWLEESASASVVLTPSSSVTSLKSLSDEANLATNSKLAIDMLGPISEPDLADADKTKVYTQTACHQIGNLRRDHRRPSCQPDTKSNNEQGIQRAAYRSSYWSADEEILEAKLRFRRYGKRVAALRAEAQKRISNATPEIVEIAPCPNQVTTDQNMTAREPEERLSWWRYLVAILTIRRAASIEDVANEETGSCQTLGSSGCNCCVREIGVY